MNRRAIYHILTVAVVLTAMGTDYLQSASMLVRAEAVVNVAERMAGRFTRAFSRRAHQPAIQSARASHWSAVRAEPIVAQQQIPQQTLQCGLHVLYLPPPLA